MITVIIPTRNRADLLALALKSLTQQTLALKDFEVLVIDNASIDQTAIITQAFSAHLRNLRYIYEPMPGLHSARHRGMQEAKGEILVFADDDIEALPTWLSSIRDSFSSEHIAMVGGNNLPMFLSPPPDWLQRMWNRPVLGKGRSLPALSLLELTGTCREFSPYLVWGCNFAIRRNVLLAAGGFHPDGMPKDLIRFRGDGETHVSRYVAESGKSCLFHPGATVYHKVTADRVTLTYFRQRGFNQGISDSYTALRGQTSPPLSIRPNLLGRLARKVWNKLNNLTLVDPIAKRALSEMVVGHSEGYEYHQCIYREDSEVRDWVHQPKYFSERSI